LVVGGRGAPVISLRSLLQFLLLWLEQVICYRMA